MRSDMLHTATGQSRTSSVLCCPDKFRGSLSAIEAASAFVDGLKACGVDAAALPLADGGEGTLEILLAAKGGERRKTTVVGPAGTPVDAEWGMLPDGTAVIELAQTSGLRLVDGANNPLTATTRGAGELILAAADSGAKNVLLCAGGSATVDGGSGAIDALGWRIPIPVVIACDVRTRFLDAAVVFGPQKGASPADVAELSRKLERQAFQLERLRGVDIRNLPGAGAGGGIAGGLAAVGAKLRPGFDVVAAACDLRQRLSESSFAITGEGRFDRTSLDGKVVGGVLRTAAATGVGAAIIAGDSGRDAEARLSSSVMCVALMDYASSAEESMSKARELILEAIKKIARSVLGVA